MSIFYVICLESMTDLNLVEETHIASWGMWM
jgi:hypothetical protein